MAAISLTHIQKTYGKGAKANTVIQDLSANIQDGEFIVIVGPSGCGKSTLLRMVAGLEEISGGTLKIGERIVNDLEPAQRDIAMVFQNYALYPHMSVYENMAYGLKIAKVPEAEIRARVDKAAAILELSHLLQRKPRELSGGQRQRVAIARALVMNPELVICDEPTSALDVSVQAQILNLLMDLRRDFNLTYVFISHNLAVVEHIATQLAVMYLGRVVEFGSTADIFKQPRHPYTQALLASVLTPEPGLGIPDMGLGLSFPDPLHPPSGCTFHPRCKQKMEQCPKISPQLKKDAIGEVSCHLYD